MTASYPGSVRTFTPKVNIVDLIQAADPNSLFADTHTQYVKVAGGSTVVTSDAGVTGLIIKGSVSQSANLQEWQDSTGTVVAYVDASGKFSAVNVSGGGEGGFTGSLLLGGI